MSKYMIVYIYILGWKPLEGKELAIEISGDQITLSTTSYSLAKEEQFCVCMYVMREVGFGSDGCNARQNSQSSYGHII